MKMENNSRMNPTILSDVDFIKEYCLSLGERYEDAKNLYLGAPLQTLVVLRSMIEDICTTIDSELGLAIGEQNIFDSIKSLQASKQVNFQIIDKLHEIRISGNKAAHPKKFKIYNHVDLALISLKGFCKLVCLVRTSVQDKMKINYHFDEEVHSSLEALAYQAIFKQNADAKYHVGKNLVELHRNELHELNISGDDSPPNQRFLSQALDLFTSAADQESHIDSAYESANFLSNGTACFKDIDRAIMYYHIASRGGNVNAKACLGFHLISSASPGDEIVSVAIAHLEEAASHYDPVALDTLSVLYKEGKHLNKDVNKSIRYLKEAADAGYPESQYKLAIYYQKANNNPELYEHYINQSIENGHAPALLSLARTSAKKLHPPVSPVDLEVTSKIYMSYFESIPDPIALFEAGQLLFVHDKHCSGSLIIVLQYWLQAYQNIDCPVAIARLIEERSSKVFDHISDVYSKKPVSSSEQLELKNLILHFDKDGIPFKTKYEGDVNKFTINSQEAFNNVAYSPKQLKQPKRRGHVPQTNKINRNDICPKCSSGKKYKKCCGR